MKFGRLMLGGLAALALQGCATPQIMSANDRGGIIKFANGTNDGAALQVADAYCRQRGRVAQITAEDAIYNHVTFVCVAP